MEKKIKKIKTIIFNSEKPSGGSGLPLGWFDKNDIKTYQKLYNKLNNNSTTAEIGVWQGRSICSVANIIIKKNIVLYAIDTFQGSNSAKDVVNNCKGKLKQIFIKNITKAGLKNNIIIIEAKSSQAINKINKKFDFVFIDGDHAEKNVKEDIATWLPNVKKGGIFAGHDYEWVKDTIHTELEILKYKVLTDKKNIYWINKNH